MHPKQYTQEANTTGQAFMDDSFFKELVENLGIITKAKYVFIAQCQRDDTPDCVDTIAFWSKGKIIENIRYALYGTPCEDVLKGNIRIYSERLQALFPEDEDLQTLEAESYLGCPIFSSSGNILGHIAILNTIPLENERELIAIIKAFASMARSEIERNQANEINRIILENSLDAFIAINTKDEITNWNKQDEC